MTSVSADPILTISDLETLKVISDPLRLKIFKAVSRYNQRGMLCTAKQIADALDIPQAKLYYHLKLLENQGLLLVEDTRLVSGIVEKLYRVTAYKLIVANDLFISDAGKEAVYPLFSEMITQVFTDLQVILQRPQPKDGEKNLSLSRHSVRLSPDQVQEYVKKFEALVKEVETSSIKATSAETVEYTLFSVFYPEPGTLKETNALDND